MENSNESEDVDTPDSNQTPHQLNRFRKDTESDKENKESQLSGVSSKIKSSLSAEELEQLEELGLDPRGLTDEEFAEQLQDRLNRLQALGISIPDESKKINVGDNSRAASLLSDLQEQQRQINDRREELNRLINKTSEKEKKIDEALGDLENKKSEIDETVEEAKDLKETASNLVKGEASASLGEEFKQRKEELRETLRYWKAASTASILLLLASSLLIYLDVSSGGGSGLALLSKVAIILPISVSVWFTVSNYSQQKKLMNEYEFKANMALSLMGFREILKEDLPEDQQEKVGEFITDTMDKIYSNPYENIQGSEQQPDNVPLTGGQGSLAKLIQSLGK